MITPKEIREYCLKWWSEVLFSYMNATSFFPKEINRIGRVNSKDILNNLSGYKQSIQLLTDNSKGNKRNSYRVIFEERNFNKIGKQLVPLKIIIESMEDYLRVTGYERDFELFEKNYLITHELPLLGDWIKSNPTKLIEHDTWTDTLKVCKYFIETPKPKLYIRQLPIDIHTKYILENKSIIQSLLEFLIPDYVNADTKFELRFNLKYSEPLIRVRFLDPSLSPIEKTTDISLPLSEFKNFNSDCGKIFVAENIMNFLTLPYLHNTLAIWSGGGFSVRYLQDIDWITNKQFFYWGDIDAQGFQILNQFRTYFPSTISIMMDEETLTNFKTAKGNIAPKQNLQRLSENELRLYNYLQENNIRLEQEKITQSFAEKKLQSLFHKELNLN